MRDFSTDLTDLIRFFLKLVSIFCVATDIDRMNKTGYLIDYKL